MLEDLVWANGTWIGWQGERLVVLSLEVTSIVFSTGKGFCALATLYSLSALTVFFSQMTGQRVCSAKGFLTVLQVAMAEINKTVMESCVFF